MIKQCKLIRDQLEYEALSCLNPEEMELGFRVNVLVTFRGFTINMKFFEEKEYISLYYNEEGYFLYKNREVAWENDCPPTEYDISLLCSKETRLLLMHSAFCFMMRAARAAANAADAANAAVAARAAAVADAAACAAYADAAARAAYADAAARAAAARHAFKEMIKYRKRLDGR